MTFPRDPLTVPMGPVGQERAPEPHKDIGNIPGSPGSFRALPRASVQKDSENQRVSKSPYLKDVTWRCPLAAEVERRVRDSLPLVGMGPVARSGGPVE